MSNKPEILSIDLESNIEELREMTDTEHEQYLSLELESNRIINKKQEDIIKKELAIAKLVALGLTEEDIKAMGI